MAIDYKESKIVRVYVVEEQEIYREAYRAILASRSPVVLLGISSNGDIGALRNLVSEISPDVVLFSNKRLDTSAIEELEQIRTDHPNIGIVLLSMFYSVQDIELLRKLALKGEGGMALFLKQSIDRIEQLVGVIIAVSQRQVILDPPLATFLFAGKPECPFLKQLTAREVEILSLLAEGYTNSAIAEVLFIDIKTVDHHLNSMYSKLKTDPVFDGKHLRVSAARLYLETTNALQH